MSESSAVYTAQQNSGDGLFEGEGTLEVQTFGGTREFSLLKPTNGLSRGGGRGWLVREKE